MKASHNKTPPPASDPSSCPLGGLGEDYVVRALLRAAGAATTPELRAGHGDDCALVQMGTLRLLLKVDAILEGVHFFPEHGAERIGRKALARPLSDIAAAGGIPRWAVVCAALPPHLPLGFAKGLYRGLGRLAKQCGVRLAGGETARSPSGLSLTVTVLGQAPNPVPGRSSAKDGDGIWVTGVLGGSYPSGHHLRFTPRLKEGRWLVEGRWASAMMDLSDGLAQDLPRLARASGVGFELYESALPRRKGCGIREALRDGEDYELLFTVSPEREGELQRLWAKAFPRVRLTRIGRMLKAGRRSLESQGYDHFAAQEG